MDIMISFIEDARKEKERREEVKKYRHIASEVIRAMNGQSGVDQRLNQDQQDRLSCIIETVLRNKLGYYERY
jgi:hypothetical protein